MRSTVRLSSHCLTALLPRLPPRVDSPYPTLPLHSPARADPLWTQSGARDFYRDQARARRVVAWSRSPSPPTISPRARTFPRTSLGASSVSPVFPNAATRPPRSSQFGPPLVSAPRPPPTLPFREVSPLALFPPTSRRAQRDTLAPGRHVSRDFRPEMTGRSDASTRRAERSEATVAGTHRAKFFRRPVRPSSSGGLPLARRARVRPRAPGRPAGRRRAPVLPWREPRARRRGAARAASNVDAPRALATTRERSARNPITANPRRRRYLTSPISSFPSVRPRAKRRSTPNTTWMATRPKF